MRVLLDGRALQPEMDGIGRYTSAISSRLPALRPSWQFTLVVSRGAAHHIPSAPNLSVIESPVPRFRPGEKRGLAGIVATSKPDLVHGFSMAGPVYDGIPATFTIHDLMVLELEGYFGPSRVRNALFRKVFRKLIERSTAAASALVVPTEWVADRLVAMFPGTAGRIAVIYEGQDLFDPMRSGGGPQRGDFLLYVGNARAYKNIPNLLRALSVVAGRGLLPPVVMVVRRDRAFGDLSKAISAAGLSGRIEVLSAVPEEKLRELYSTCLAFVSPSLSEGFGLPVLEAMAAGAPVLASRGTALEEVAGDGALLVDPRDPEAIAAGVAELCGSAEMRSELSAKASARSILFSWEAASAQIADMLEGVLTR